MSSVLLVILAAFSRLVPHWPNVTAVGALALFSGARLRRGASFAIPLAAMALSDLLIDFGSGRPLLTPVRAAVYGGFAATVLLGRFLQHRSGIARLAALSLSSSVIFFAVTNLAMWVEGGIYPRSASGLAACYVAALPFFRNEIFGDLAWTAVLFGLDALIRRRRAEARPAPAVSVLS